MTKILSLSFSITRKVHIDIAGKAINLKSIATRNTHTPGVSPGPAVINLSQKTFEHKKLHIFSEGWKFSIPPKHTPVEQIYIQCRVSYNSK